MGAKILKIYEMCKKVLLFCYFQFMGKWLTSSGKQSTFLGSKKPDPEAILRNSTFCWNTPNFIQLAVVPTLYGTTL